MNITIPATIGKSIGTGILAIGIVTTGAAGMTAISNVMAPAIGSAATGEELPERCENAAKVIPTDIGFTCIGVNRSLSIEFGDKLLVNTRLGEVRSSEKLVPLGVTKDGGFNAPGTLSRSGQKGAADSPNETATSGGPWAYGR